MRPSIVPAVLAQLPLDGVLLFATRFIRLFAYGSLSVVLVFYLIGIGLSEPQTGTLLTLTLVGDTVISLYLTTRADRMGRRRALVVGAALMAAAGMVFASASAFCLSIEQAALTHVATDRTRTEVLAWYTLVGSLATALGALAAGFATRGLHAAAPPSGYRVVVILYAVLGVTLAALFSGLSPAVETPGPSEGRAFRPAFTRFSGLDRSRDVVVKLAALFALDSFAGGFVIQSFAAYWFYLRFGADPALLGTIFFWANIFAGLSALLASRLAARFGLIRTMVATHLPSNVLLILIPLMPTLSLAVLVLLARFSISQMDVPTRQSYLMAVVSPDERSAAAGIAGVARTIGAAIGPLFVGLMFARPALINLPFFIAGTLKITYDLLLYRAFVRVQPPEEKQRQQAASR